MTGRGGQRNSQEAARLFEAAAKLGHASLGLQSRPALSRGPAVSAGFRESGRAVPRRGRTPAIRKRNTRSRPSTWKAAAWRRTSARRRGCWARRRWRSMWTPKSEYAIALFNGTGVAKNEAAAGTYLRRAANSGNPVAQSRLAFMYATGRGLPANAVAGREVAHDREGRRNQRPVPGGFRPQDEAGGSRVRRADSKALDRRDQRDCPALTDVAASGQISGAILASISDRACFGEPLHTSPENALRTSHG